MGDGGLYSVGNKLDILDFVVEVKHLTVAVKLTADGIVNHSVIVLHNVCLHGAALTGCLIKHGNVTDSAHRHVKRTGDWGRGKHQSVNISCHFAQLFLLCDAKALLLVYDKKAKVTELYVLRNHGVRTDKNIHPAVFGALDNLAAFLRLSES